MVLIAMPREASGHEPKDAAGSFALVCEDEMRASDQIASLNEELRIARAALERAEAERAEAKYWWDKIRADNEALRAELAAAKQAAWGDNGRTKIFDHKWLDPQCIAMGCQSLILRAALVLAEAEKIKLQNSFSEGRTQLMAEIAKAQAAMCQKALYKSERDALRAELNDKSNQIVELQTELERCFNLEAELDAAEAESDRLRDELAAAQEIKKMDDFNLSQHKMVTMDRFHKIQRLEAELAAMREALDRYRYAVAFASADAWDGGPDIRQRFAWARANDHEGHLSDNRIAEIGQTFTALQSHRRTET